jgi:hypothetical protein
MGLSFEIITKSEIRESEIDVTRTRVRLLNSMISDFENTYFDSLIFVASKNAIKGLSYYYSTNSFSSGVIKYQLWKALDKTIHAGELDGLDLTKSGCGGPCMDFSHTMEGLVEIIKDYYSLVGIEIIELELEINDIKQIDPWTLQVVAGIKYELKDKSDIAGWRGYSERNVNVDVFGLYYDHRIIKKKWKVHCQQTSILDRLDGKTGKSSNCMGIHPGVGP